MINKKNYTEMNQNILNKLNSLGGNTDDVNEDRSFVENWQSVKFTHYLYDKEWDVYGIDKFYEANINLYQTNEKKFYQDLLEHYFSEHEFFYGQDFYKNWLFTPFKPGSKDFGEFDGLVEENDVKAIVQGTEMDFICIFYSYGFPDHFFVCSTDPNQSNPIVYSTDHEVYFQEIENEGTLEEFLDKYMTKQEFLDVVKEYLESKFGK